MFRLALVGENESGPIGVKQIAERLNDRGLRTQTGGRWGVGAVHQILTRTTYIGQHQFNRGSRRSGPQKKPEEEIVTYSVPAIIEREVFDAVQAALRSRSPQLKAPRFVSGPTLLGGICFCADCGGAMTLRTSGKADHYRYYTCSTKARQGRGGCRGRTIRTSKLDDLVVGYVERHLLAPDRLEAVLGELIERREERLGKARQRISELRRQAADADAKLSQLYSAIEAGVADLSDSNLKGRVDELKKMRDAAQADADRAAARTGAPVKIDRNLLREFGAEARRRMRSSDGGFRRDQIQALTQRVEVAANEIRIKGSKTELLRTLVTSGAGHGVETAANGVRSFVPKWLPRQDSNLRPID